MPKGNGEIPGSRIGPKAKAFAAFLRFGIKISERDVTTLFHKAFNLKIAASSISGFMDSLKEEALPIYKELLSALKKGSFIRAGINKTVDVYRMISMRISDGNW